MAISVNLSSYKAPTSVGGIKLPTKGVSSTPQKKYTDNLASLNLGNLGGVSQAGITNRNLLPSRVSGMSTATPAATAPTPVKITMPTEPTARLSSPALATPAAQNYLGMQSDAQPADASMSTGNTYSSTPEGGVASREPRMQKPQKTAYQSALDSYLSSLKTSSKMDEQVAEAQLGSRRQYNNTLDSSGGTTAGASQSAALVNRRNTNSLADLGILQNSANTASNLALERLKYEQGQLPTAQDGFTLSPGQNRYDASGNLLASGGTDALAERKFNEDVRQFGMEYALKQQQESRLGATTSQGQASAGQVESLAGFDSTIGAANEALQLLAGGVSTGPIAGRLLQAAKLSGTQNPQQLVLEQIIGKLKADFMKALSGAAVSDKEVVRLSKFLPDITDQESVIQSKLNTLINETNRAKMNLSNSIGSKGNIGGGSTSGGLFDW